MMTEAEIRAEITRLLEAGEHSKPWYGSGEKAVRNTAGDALFESIKALIKDDLDDAAGDGRTDATAS
ncbi:MAG: hypothetical protein RIT24_1906 [Planctomycetota bacterium]|jgi:hypothetical protein